MGKTIKN